MQVQKGQWNKKCGIKIGGTKIGGTKIWCGPLAIGWQGSLVQVHKGQRNKNAEQKMAEQKFGGDPQGA